MSAELGPGSPRNGWLRAVAKLTGDETSDGVNEGAAAQPPALPQSEPSGMAG